MINIYPAIDLIDGKAVRLASGDYARKTEYSTVPAETAKNFVADGANYIHIVDLDGAKAGQPANLEVIKSISSAVEVPLQIGGGIRSAESAKKLLEYADRVIIGTVAITRPEILEELIREFSNGKIIVSIDYKDGNPAINGWTKSVLLDTKILQDRLYEAGVKIVIVTDSEKDGLMAGPNLQLIKQWVGKGFEVICAGGVTSLKDIKDLEKTGADGVIIGKALYEGRIDLKEAINAG